MPKQLAKTDGYKELVKKIQAELSELDFFIKRRTAEAYWKVGKFIHEHILENKEQADYGSYVLENLADDVDRDVSTLRRALKFYRIYPIRADRHELSWNHYKWLITVQDKSKREAFEKIALKREWTAERLEEAIRLDKLKIEPPKEKFIQTLDKKLPVLRSRLYTYQILEPSYIHPEEEFCVVDLGFNINIKAELKGISKPKQGDIIESIKTGNNYSFRRSDAAKKELYTYKALVERVVDGDTIWLNIDLGFSSWLREKVRLRGIDCPEIDTPKGKEAKEFVEAKLKEVNFVVIKTYNEPDKYERYLADIFYQAQETDPQKVLEEGTFLNQELLDKNLAKPF